MNKKINKVSKILLPALIVILISGYFRFHNIGFGLFHSFYADEPEIVELAIKYTYEIRDIISNNNIYKLIPISYVYGTAPTYFFTAVIMLFSKTSNMLGISFDKMSLYLAARSVNAFISLIIPIAGAFLYKRLYKDKFGFFVALLLLGLNWKLISHAHYVNADLFQTIFLVLSFLFLYLYFKKENDTKFTILTGIFYGVALGTKITTLISLPLYLYVFLAKRNVRNTVAFGFVTLGTYIATNPFSVIFVNDFLYRIVEMRIKEAGMVFDSVDSNPFKYILALGFMVTVPVLILSLYGIFLKLREKAYEGDDRAFHWFLIGHILIYIGFFSLQQRRVDRWLLPLIPIVIIYASYAISYIREKAGRIQFYLMWALIISYYLFFSVLLLFQFQPNTPKSAAYLWMQEYIHDQTWKLVYTEEGLDPMNKLKNADVYKYNVYSSENAQFFLPMDPYMYDYVVLSSRPMENFKREEVKQAYPYYYERWNGFENTVLDPTKFELIKEFTLPKPNLIPLSDVFIYKNLEPAARPAPPSSE